MAIGPTKQELLNRIETIYKSINLSDSNWDVAFVVDRINQFYLTNTMQNAIFVLKSNGEYAYFVRSSFERAKMESPLDNIYPMATYKDLLPFIEAKCPKAYIETEIMTYATLERLKKYVDISELAPLDGLLVKARAVKSAYELSCMEESGRQHNYLFETVVPGLLREGMSEADLTAEMYEKMIKLGYHGVTRFTMFQMELVIGQVGFGESSLMPTSFDGAGGTRGICPAVPTVGSRERTLKKGDLVFVDIGYGYNGYHTDKTQLYMFNQSPPDEIVEIQKACIDIEKKASALLKIGNIPSEIYNTVMSELDIELLPNFMGFNGRRVKFLGHGVGLKVDEYPVIASGFNEPLIENMTIALEPKNGVTGVGLIGVEDTYVVTKDGGRCITGGGKEIIVI